MDLLGSALVPLMARLERPYPSPWRIQDWDSPLLPLPIQAVNRLPRSLVRWLYPLDETSLLNAARRQTGLDDFGSQAFLTPLRLLLKDFQDRDLVMTSIGRIAMYTLTLQFLKARLGVEARARETQAWQTQRVDRPLIIVGLPRTGTTHLQNLLAEVQSLRYLPFWQTIEPIRAARTGRDRRRERQRLQLAITNYLAPLMRRMHEMEVDLPHEELSVTAMDFSSYLFECTVDAPHYRKWYAEQDQTPGYQYLNRVLQLLQLEPPPVPRAPNPRWLLKSPQHLEHLETLVKVFPDARIVLTHRAPDEAISSMVTMILYASRLTRDYGRLRDDAAVMIDRLEQMLRRSREQVARLDPRQVHWVDFKAFMADPVQTVQEVAAFADVELSATSLDAVKAHQAARGRHRLGRIDYHLEDLGVDMQALHSRFAFAQTHP